LPISENSEIVVAGQTGAANAPQRIETNLKFRPNETHQIRLNTSFGNLGKIKIENADQTLGQFSVQALDEWKVRDNVIFVFGFDYSRFLGAGDDFSLSPRFGLQFDLPIPEPVSAPALYDADRGKKLGARDRTGRNDRRLPRIGRDAEDFVVENGRPQMNKSSRLEFGVERILDSNSIRVEANMLFRRDKRARRRVDQSTAQLSERRGR
jgi:hypothetical protein